MRFANGQRKNPPPTYKYILQEEVSEWGPEGIVIDDGLFLAADGALSDVADGSGHHDEGRIRQRRRDGRREGENRNFRRFGSCEKTLAIACNRILARTGTASTVRARG